MKKGKVLALDYGKRRVGIASGDLETRIAFPRDVFLNKGVSYLIEKIKILCDELGVSLIIVGLPLNMDFEELENEMIQEVKYFAKELTEGLKDVKVEFFDERLSSFEAREMMKKWTKKRKGFADARRGGAELDAYAAQVILQRFFDKLV